MSRLGKKKSQQSAGFFVDYYSGINLEYLPYESLDPRR